MDTQAIFGLQFLLSLLAWGVIVGFLLSPRLAKLPQHEALLWLSLPHAFRHVGMVVLVPGVVDQPLPTNFAETAAYGDLTRGPRVVDEHVRGKMQEVLTEIQDGTFARQWIDENKSGQIEYKRMMSEDLAHQIEEVGADLRSRMDWLEN